MSRKIRNICIIILFILCLMVSGKSLGASFTITSAQHWDPYMGENELLPQGIDAGANSAAGGTFCIQKGGSLRFTSAEVADTQQSSSAHTSTHCGTAGTCLPTREEYRKIYNWDKKWNKWKHQHKIK